MARTVVTFYRFADLPDCGQWAENLKELCGRRDVRGTVILAPEGVNATLSGPKRGVDAVLAFIRTDERFADLPHRECETERPTFHRLRIYLRDEIVTFGDPELNPRDGAGEYVSPEDWNALLDDPEVLLLDVRNDYEVELGTFRGAVNPLTSTFGEWKSYVKEELAGNKERPIAMFCTGGIRCEKASAHLLAEGFQNVLHLRGGILNYLEKVEPEDSLWDGECFVFDQRVALVHGLKEGASRLCFGCRAPLKEEDLRSPRYEEGVSCPKCFEQTGEDLKDRRRERHRQQRLAEKRGEEHVGQKMPLT